MMTIDTSVPVEKVAPTAQEAAKVASEQFTDKETVAMVQRLLLAKGYVDGGPPDGELNQKTKDEILVFRARAGLQLIPVIDRELISCLEIAPPKALPVEQVTATKADVAPKVEVVAIADKVQRSAWWTKLWAWIIGIPSGLFTLLGAIVNNLDEATAAIQPVRNLLYDVQGVPTWFWIATIVGLACIMGYQGMVISSLSHKQEEAAIDGYQRGTIKNDIPPTDEA